MPAHKIPIEERFWPNVDKSGDCWEWTGVMFKNGYGKVFYEGQSRGAHRVSAVLAGMDVEGTYVCHHCDNKRCVKPDHLFLGSNKDNQDDMVVKRRGYDHRRHWNTKLTETQVVEIKQRRAAGETLVSIAKDYGVSHVHVSLIARGKSRRVA